MLQVRHWFRVCTIALLYEGLCSVKGHTQLLNDDLIRLQQRCVVGQTKLLSL